MPSDDPFPAAQTLPQEREGSKSPGRRSYRHLVVASALIALTAGVGKGMSSASLDAGDFASIGTIITFSIAIISVLIGLTVNRGDIVRSTRRIYSSLMLLGVAVLLASCFGFDLSYLSIGKESLWMVLSCFMAYMVFRFDFSPVRAFGIGQAVYFLTSTAAWALGGYLSVTFGSGSASMLIAVLFAFLIVLILTFVFTDADLKFILTWHPQEAGDRDDFVGFAPTDAGTRPSYGSPSPAALAPTAARNEDPESELALHERIARIDPRCGLSSREAEILEKFAQGRSTNWIAEDLTISKNTVRSHLRAIYTKLDVHTRQELLDFLKNVR
jgi:DNA-binding CsgD family transcriptional regulator